MSPVLVLNPRADLAFVQLAERVVEHGAATPEELETALRERYRDAVVRARDLSSERLEVWYVYRDGRWVAD